MASMTPGMESKFGDIELAKVELVAHAGCLCGFFEAAGAAEVAHGGDDLSSRSGQIRLR